MDLYERRQFEEAAADDDAAANAAQIEAAVLDVHTSGPGIVVSFDRGKQTATVRPVAHKFFRGQGFKPLPDLMDVPVQFPGGGGFVLTFPVAAGDEGILIFAERAIDAWHASGKAGPPHEFRAHSLSDACLVVGVRSLPRAVQSFNGGGVELRSLDGKTVIGIEDGNVKVSAATGDIELASGGSGNIKLNVVGPTSQLVTGVLTGATICPFTKAPPSAAGPTGIAARVHAGAT